jgi:hypothetical protein
MCYEIALARHVNLLSALTSKIRHETSDAEIRHFVTRFNSGDTATLLLGTRHAAVESAVRSYSQPWMGARPWWIPRPFGGSRTVPN